MQEIGVINLKNYMIINDKLTAPIFLNGVIHEHFDETMYNEGMGYSWNRPFFNKDEFPKELWLITTNKIEFDYYKNFLGHIVEERFLNLIDESNSLKDFVIAKLNIVSPRGKSKVKKNYFFIKYFNGISLVDYDQSDFISREVPENKVFKSEGVFVEKYQKVVFGQTDLDVFCLKDLKLSSYMFCSEKFMQQCIALKLKGFKFIELDEVATHINSR
ncbi:Imm43 family immunity protein [Lysinibacillus sp. NPDC093688]|uniref:Imm43 family immunity protein n=1 Tax=Lysinibacillus sp. NPDC093688 TaxID=3390577 RepID=UPI003D060834